MPEIKIMYRCSCCRDLHDDEDDARECCAPDVFEVFQCPECERIHDAEVDAEGCCGAVNSMRCPACARDYRPSQIGYHAISLAGHCHTCQPFFSVPQQFAIEDALLNVTGAQVSLLRGDMS